ncbi:Uncharacterised protein [Vibrio cholerae]|nr:Uncharacterised protein [Vibrio cholerae]
MPFTAPSAKLIATVPTRFFWMPLGVRLWPCTFTSILPVPSSISLFSTSFSKGLT